MESSNGITNYLKNPIQNLDSSKIKVTPILSNKKSKNNSINYENKNKSLQFSHDVVNNGGSLTNQSPNSNSSQYSSFLINDLIPYPSSSISTTIEKADNVNHNVYNNPRSIISNKKKTKTKKTNNLQHEIITPHESQLSSPSHSDESLINKPSQNPLNQNKLYIDNDKISRIVKSLKEKKDCASQTVTITSVSQYAQVNIVDDSNDPNMFTLQRSNQALRSQLDQLSYVIEEMSKERSATNMQIHSFQKQINVKNLKIEEIEAEKDKYLANNDELRFGLKNMEKLISDYRRDLNVKNVEIESFKQQLNLVIQEKTDLEGLNENIKNDLVTKEKLVNELNDQDNVKKNQIESLNNELISTNEKLKHFELERNLTKKSSQLNDHATPLCLNQLQTNVSKLKENFVELKTDVINHRNNLMADFGREFVNILNIGKLQEMKWFEKIQKIEQYQIEIERLKKLNDQLNKDKSFEKNRNIELNIEFQSMVNHIKTENENLKQSNCYLEQKFSALNLDYKSLSDEKQKLLSELENVKNVCNNLRLDSNQQNVNKQDLEVFKNKNDQLVKECENLKQNIVKLEQTNSVLNEKLESITGQLEDYDKNKFFLEHCQKEIDELRSKLGLETETKETLKSDLNTLRTELKAKKEKINNLESNIQLLTKKYRELVAIRNESAAQDEKFKKSEEEQASLKLEIDELKRILTEKDNIILEQNSKLFQFESDFQQKLDHLRNESQEKISSMENFVQEKENCILELQEKVNSTNDQHFQFDKKISALESDLANEKERSIGLSKSLFNEKRTINKLKSELKQVKEQLAKQNTIGGDVDIQTDQHYATNQSRQKTSDSADMGHFVHNETTTQNSLHSSSDNPCNDPLPGDHLPNTSAAASPENVDVSDYIIQFLDQTQSNEAPETKPLSKLHSSVEDLKQELQNLKLTFLQSCEYKKQTDD